jgi:hypothetical protein
VVGQPARTAAEADARVAAGQRDVVGAAAVRTDEPHSRVLGRVVLVQDPPAVGRDLRVDVTFVGDHRSQASGVAAVRPRDHQVVAGVVRSVHTMTPRVVIN